MQSCNTMSRAEFILMHCFWGFVVWLWYVPFVFRCLDLKTEPQSMWILTAIVTASSIAGILADITADRRGENVFFNLAMGYGIYTVLACYRICRTLILCSLWTASALSVLCAFCLLSAQIPTGRNASRALHRRWMQSALVPRGSSVSL